MKNLTKMKTFRCPPLRPPKPSLSGTILHCLKGPINQETHELLLKQSSSNSDCIGTAAAAGSADKKLTDRGSFEKVRFRLFSFLIVIYFISVSYDKQHIHNT